MHKTDIDALTISSFRYAPLGSARAAAANMHHRPRPGCSSSAHLLSG